MKKTLLPFFFACFCCLYANAQSAPIKWGKIEPDDIEMSVYPQDSGAAAVVLADYGTVEFNFRSSNGISLKFNRHVRIKILKKTGLNHADVSIPIYKGGEDLVGSVKGVSYTQKDGKIQETELEKDQVYTQELNDYYDVIKFSMPNVKEGSVFEYKYSINSEYIFSLVGWEFQRDIPTRWSEFRAEIPEYFHYKTLMSGYLPLTVLETTKGTDIDRNIVTNYRWAVEHAPALKEEKYITTMSDYTSKIEFELQTINIPGRILEHVSHTWEKLNADLNKNENFGRQLGKGKYMEASISRLTAGARSDGEKVKLITEFVRQNFRYNGKKRLFASNNQRKTFDEKEGNSADINLLLVSMLQMAGLEANPVILSTRENGRVNFTPLLQDFNYVIAHVRLGEKEMLLDGTDPDLPYDMLPFYCLNQQGRLISPEYTSWVSLGNGEKIKESIQGAFVLKPDGSLAGEFKFVESGYAASRSREKIKSEGEEKYLASVRAREADWDIQSYEHANLDNVNKDIEEVFKLELLNRSMPAADKIYFQPLLTGSEKENPFKLEKREYPVDFGCPIEEMCMFQIEIPEGYVVEELPAAAVFALPEKSAVFRYNLSNLGNKIAVMSILQINKAVFVGQEYAALKQFYDLVIAKQAEQVVLKKVN